MADIVLELTISDVFKEIARRSSIATETDPFYSTKSMLQKQNSQLHGDRLTRDFAREAAKEVLKAFLNRLYDVDGEAFEFDSATNPGKIIYRFAESNDPLPANQTAAIVANMSDNIRDARIYYILVSLYRTDGNKGKEAELTAKAQLLIDELSAALFRLHD